MFLAIRMVILFAAFLLLGSCATQQDGRKWIPDIIPGVQLPSGTPAFILVLKEEKTLCASWHNQAECHELWRTLPTQFSHTYDKREVEYLREYNHVTERVRLSQEVFCAIFKAKFPRHSFDCGELWESFARFKQSENL